ncbi:MAG: sulfatase-like hydrolase/transferase [Chthoniobacteraceae bacterium]
MKHARTFLAALLLTPLAALHADAKPNIVIILADDLGYGDVQCYNPERGKIPTPNMDRIAAQGMRFTDAHSSSGVCSPSRYTLLMGRYHWRTKLQVGIVALWGDPLIAPERMTLGTLAKRQGYRTACIGKWHLGWDWPITEEQMPMFKGFGGKPGGGGKVTTSATDAHRETWQAVFSQRLPGGPIERGFDEYFGTDVPNWPPYCFIEGDRTVGIPGELLPAPGLQKNQASTQGPALKDWKLTGILLALADRAVQTISEFARKKEPFLNYLPLTAPHTPLAVNAEWKGRSGLNDYADLVMETDAVVGRVLKALDKSGAAENTLVVFTSDNGCAPYIDAKELEKMGHFPSGPLRGYKSDAWEGGHRVPFMVRWPGVVQPGSVSGQLVYQDCGSTACATFARFQGSTIGGWDFKKLCPSPLGTGTDWGHLLDASAKLGQQWKLITFTPDDAGFEKATAFLKSELDAGRPVVVDFKYFGPQYPGGSAGHTLNVTGYIAAENLYILCNPAVATPGLQLITADDLKDFWRSDHYGELSKGILSRPAFLIVQP